MKSKHFENSSWSPEVIWVFSLVFMALLIFGSAGPAHAQIGPPNTKICKNGTVVPITAVCMQVCPSGILVEEGAMCPVAISQYAWESRPEAVTFAAFVSPAGRIDISLNDKGGPWTVAARNDTGSLQTEVGVGCNMSIPWQAVATEPKTGRAIVAGNVMWITTQPCMSIRAQVVRLYIEFLGHTGDTGGIDFWTQQWIENGEKYVRNEFMSSPEYINLMIDRLSVALCRSVNWDTRQAIIDTANKRGLPEALVTLAKVNNGTCNVKGGRETIGEEFYLPPLPAPKFN